MCALPRGRLCVLLQSSSPERQRRGFAPRHRGFHLSASWIWEGIGLYVYLSRVDLRAGEGVVVGTHLDLFPPTVLLGVDGCRLLASLSLASRDFRLPTVDLGQMFSLMKLCTNQLAPRASRGAVQCQGRGGEAESLGIGNTRRRDQLENISKSRFSYLIYGRVGIICSQFYN